MSLALPDAGTVALGTAGTQHPSASALHVCPRCLPSHFNTHGGLVDLTRVSIKTKASLANRPKHAVENIPSEFIRSTGTIAACSVGTPTLGGFYMRHLVPHGTPANFIPSAPSQASKRGHPQPSLPCTNAHTQWSGREKKIQRDNLTVHRNRWLHGSGSSGPPVAQGPRAGGAARKSCTPAFAPGPQSLERTAMLVERGGGGGKG